MARQIQLILRTFGLAWYRMRGISLTVTGTETIPPKRAKLVIASLHTSARDPFVLCLAMPPHLYPVHFLGTRWFATPALFLLALTGIMPLFYALCGVITVQKGKGLEKNLAPAFLTLNTGGVIALFPEGSRYHDGTVRPFKRGVAVMAQRTGAPVLPATIAYNRKNIHIAIGPLLHISAQENEKSALEKIRNACVRLL